MIVTDVIEPSNDPPADVSKRPVPEVEDRFTVVSAETVLARPNPSRDSTVIAPVTTFGSTL